MVFLGFLLVMLWLVFFVGFHVVGWFIHILLVVAVVMFLVRVIQGRNPLR